MKKIKTICLNCFGVPLFNKRKIRFELIGQELAKTNADIINLQEVFDFRDLKILIKYLGDKYNVLYTSKKFFIHSGLVIFIKKEIKYFDYKFKQFDNQGNKTLFSFPDGIAGKGFQSIKFIVEGSSIFFLNAHLMCQYNESLYLKKSHIDQVNELSRVILSNGCSTIISGDLNCRPNSSELIQFRSKNKLYEKLENYRYTVDLMNRNRGKFMNIFSHGHSFRTDYTFVSENIILTKQNIIFDNLVKDGDRIYHISDHYGIYSEIEI